jgi:hypothetical protein
VQHEHRVPHQCSALEIEDELGRILAGRDRACGLRRSGERLQLRRPSLLDLPDAILNGAWARPNSASTAS